jgi:hypothetical protein
LARRRSLWPAFLALAAVLVVSIAGVWICLLSTAAQDAEGPREPTLEELRQQRTAHQHKARAYIATGNFCLALEQLDAVADGLRRQTGNGQEEMLLKHQRRELGIYADLLEEPLEEILEQAVGLPAAEWQAQFRKRYQGRAIIFDTQLGREGAAGIKSSYQLLAQGETAQFNCTDLPIFRHLPLDRPRRVLFGARLAKMHRITSTSWTIQLDPDSALWLTDPQAAAVSCPPLGTPAVRALLDQQKQRVETMSR